MAGAARYSRLGDMSVGRSIYLNVGGSSKEFVIVHQGKPSSMYDDSCNGTWLLSKNVISNRQWHSQNVNNYGNSSMHSYLNGTFVSSMGNQMRSLIKTALLPYTEDGTVLTGASGLSAKVFLLAAYELGFDSAYSRSIPVDGAKLDYFSDSASRLAQMENALVGGGYASYWSRSPYLTGSTSATQVSSAGGVDADTCSNSDGMRPALILPLDTLIDGNGEVVANTAPTTPASITYPASIMSGSVVNISWDASSDTEGNLTGYKVDASTDGGTTWNQIYQGTATSTSWTSYRGSGSVIFRVKAYDALGAESGYCTGTQSTIISNTAPTTPGSISVPTTVKGGSTVTITWGASTDADGNLSGYKLERSVDSGTYEQIYSGTSRRYTDNVGTTWGTVSYRVKAFDPYAESGYVESPTRTVIQANAPVITCSYADGTDLGTKSSGFSIAYSVDDADSSDTITVKEYMDGKLKRTFTATRNTNYSFAVTGDYFMKLLNGAHVMTIEASDGTSSVAYVLKFTKAVYAARVTPQSPIAASGLITSCAISIVGDIPSGATLSVEVTNNASDATPVWEDCTSEVLAGTRHTFTNRNAQTNAFSFKVEVARGTSNGGYISSIQGNFSCD